MYLLNSFYYPIVKKEKNVYYFNILLNLKWTKLKANQTKIWKLSWRTVIVSYSQTLHETYAVLTICLIKVSLHACSAKGKALGTKVNTNQEWTGKGWGPVWLPLHSALSVLLCSLPSSTYACLKISLSGLFISWWLSLPYVPTAPSWAS